MHAASQPGVIEWLLNALWLVLTLTAAWSVRRRSSFRSRFHGQVTALVALACAATIVFPVISLSDDLYCEQWATEARSLTVEKHERAAPCLGTTQTVLAYAAFPHLRQFSRCTVAMLSADHSAAPALGYVQPSAGRAPPPLISQPF